MKDYVLPPPSPDNSLEEEWRFNSDKQGNCSLRYAPLLRVKEILKELKILITYSYY